MMTELKKNISLAPYTTFRIGGIVKNLWECQNAEELLAVISELKKLKKEFVIIAGGSNILFGNKKREAVIVFRQKTFSDQDWKKDGDRIICNAAVYLDNFISKMVEEGWGGLEKMSWIPGTVAGATVGNAGAYGHSAGEVIDAVEIFDGKKRRWLSKNECAFSYRESIFKKKKWLVLNVAFKLTKQKSVLLEKTRNEIIADRKSKFFEKIKCPGSFFKNVLVSKVSKKSLALVDQSKIRDGKISVGYLLEAVGAKGMREGGIYVAPFHGNLILNDGAGTYKQVIKLSTKLKKLAKDRFGISLEEEVKIVV